MNLHLNMCVLELKVLNFFNLKSFDTLIVLSFGVFLRILDVFLHWSLNCIGRFVTGSFLIGHFVLGVL